jgi:hypothetical protein
VLCRLRVKRETAFLPAFMHDLQRLISSVHMEVASLEAGNLRSPASDPQAHRQDGTGAIKASHFHTSHSLCRGPG